MRPGKLEPLHPPALQDFGGNGRSLGSAIQNFGGPASQGASASAPDHEDAYVGVEIGVLRNLAPLLGI